MLADSLDFTSNRFPETFGDYIIFGKFEQHHHTFIQYPSVGWVNSNGPLGKASWNGSFIGHIFGVAYGFMTYGTTYYIGAVGFTGIALSNGYFIGTALHIDLAQS